VCCVCNLPYASEHFIYEPLTAGTLETMAIGVETSYKCVMALKVRVAYSCCTLCISSHFCDSSEAVLLLHEQFFDLQRLLVARARECSILHAFYSNA
jgi:hypothetical protein